MGTSHPRFLTKLLPALLISVCFLSCSSSQRTYSLRVESTIPAHTPLFLPIPFSGEYLKLSSPDVSLSPTIGEYIPADSAYLFFLDEAIPASSNL
ncbi:MAG: hypothetical protein AAFR66_00870, partial [Bacteroidota bacterium]